MRLPILVAVIAFLGVICPVNASALVNEDRVVASRALAHYSMGQIYDFLGMPEAAVLEYEKASQFDQSSYSIRLRLGLDYARLNMLLEAKEQLKASQALNVEDLQSHYLLALIYSAERDYDAAALEYEHILKKLATSEPRNTAIYGYLAQLYYSQRKFDQAIVQYEKILELDSQNTDVMYLLGALYYENKQTQKAIDILNKSLEINPDNDGSLNTLGYIYVEENQQLDKAISLISKAVSLDPYNGAYLDSLGWAYYKKGDLTKALEILLKADNLMQDPVIKDHLGDVSLKLSRPQDAIKYWELALKLLPGQMHIIKKLNDVKQSQASR